METQGPPLTPDQQQRHAVQEMARNVLSVGNQIMEEGRFSREFNKGPNLAWILFATEAPSDGGLASFAAQTLKQAAEEGVTPPNGIGLNLHGLNWEPALSRYGNALTATHYLTVDFARRLGFPMPEENKGGLSSKVNRDKGAGGVVELSHQTMPFDFEGHIVGPLQYSSEPRLGGFSLKYKTPTATPKA